MSEELYEQMKQSVIDGEVEDAERLAQEGLDAGIAPGDILDKGFVKGIEEVGDLFARGEFFLPELLVSADIFTKAIEVIKPYLTRDESSRRGLVVLGTVKGDIHKSDRSHVVL